MKQITKRSSRVAGLIVLFALLLLSTYANAQSNQISQLTNKDMAIRNLISGIQSENYGLRKSAIYFAGKYEVTECADLLLNQLKEEKDPTMRKLIVRVLHKIGDSEVYDTILKLARNDSNSSVRNLCIAVYNDHVSQSRSDIAVNKQ